jgi:hypothetical protein
MLRFSAVPRVQLVKAATVVSLRLPLSAATPVILITVFARRIAEAIKSERMKRIMATGGAGFFRDHTGPFFDE